MTREFIPYEQALELKELGFDEKCLGYYNIDPSLNYVPFNPAPPFEHDWCLPAPLYQQAFRWFREKYGLHAIIFPTQQQQRYVWCIRWMQYRWYKDIPYADSYTYEEAELECLKKLIEIIKTK